MEENNILLGVACFAILLAVLGVVNYKRYRDNRRHALELASKNRKINRQYALLKKHYEENEILLREIHHRVKNNLQLAASLLNIQLRTTQNPDAVRALQESSSRLQTMILVHRELYSQPQLKTVNLLNYVRNLVEYLIQSYLPQGYEVTTKLDISANLNLETERLTALGLIMTELITNSLKYATPPDNMLQLNLKICRDAAKQYTLIYGDNGGGFPEGFNPAQEKTMGLRLVRDLSRQLGATLTYPGPKSSFFNLTFNDI